MTKFKNKQPLPLRRLSRSMQLCLLLPLLLPYMSACVSRPVPIACPQLPAPPPALMVPPTYRQQWDSLVTSDPTPTTYSIKPTPKSPPSKP